MSSTRPNPTWYDYQLQVYRDVPSHFAHEVPIPAKNRHSHLYAVLPIFPSKPSTHLSVNRDVRVHFHVRSLSEDVPSILSMLPTVRG